jgi:hypothetical protein
MLFGVDGVRASGVICLCPRPATSIRRRSGLSLLCIELARGPPEEPDHNCENNERNDDRDRDDQLFGGSTGAREYAHIAVDRSRGKGGPTSAVGAGSERWRCRWRLLTHGCVYRSREALRRRPLRLSAPGRRELPRQPRVSPD